MKKIILAITAISIIGISCNKTSNIMPTKGAVNNENVRSTENQEKAIGSFLTKYIHKENNANKRVFAEPLSIMNAEQEIENALNYEYCYFERTETTWQEHHQFSINTSIASNEMSAQEIQQLYTDIINELKNQNHDYLSQYAQDEIQLALVDLQLVEENGMVKANVDDYFSIPIKDLPTPVFGKWIFKYVDGGWQWSDKGGFWQNPTTSQYVGNWGAPEKITQYANHNLFWTAQAGGYYTNNGFFRYWNVLNNNLNISNFHTLVLPAQTNYYSVGYPNYILPYAVYDNFNLSTTASNFPTEKLPSGAMNFYTDNVVSFLSVVVPNNNLIPAGKSMSSFSVHSSQTFSQNNYVGIHDIFVNYGTFNPKIIKNPLPLFN